VFGVDFFLFKFFFTFVGGTTIKGLPGLGRKWLCVLEIVELVVDDVLASESRLECLSGRKESLHFCVFQEFARFFITNFPSCF